MTGSTDTSGIRTSVTGYGTKPQDQFAGLSHELFTEPFHTWPAIVTVAVADNPVHTAASAVLVTVYVPDLLADTSIWPVAVLMKTSPGVDENVPATPPGLRTGNGSAPFWQ